ncbi:hypothetical protein Q7A53_17120 [Halobacillus rhizosphaerae]|uniref:hypothetical protein n=1 Tax=Halobacillus rhizosphaerae TaxID=3064889 RepID=UPI00398A8D47
MDTKLINSLAKMMLKKDKRSIIKNTLKDFLIENGDQISFNWHPLGFLHSKLGHAAEVGDIRLHVWLPNNRKTQEPPMPIHDHVFNINSFILLGKVTNHIYDLTSSLGDKRQLYRVEYNNEGSLLKPLDTVIRCKLKSSQLYNKGEFYEVNKDKFHQTFVEIEDFTVTLVLTTDKDPVKEPNILGPLGQEEYFYKREKCEFPVIELFLDLL